MAVDDVGDRGQWLFCLLRTQLCAGRNEPYFRPRALGDKSPTFDYLVELVGSEAYFFFVQVQCHHGAVSALRVVHRANLERNSRMRPSLDFLEYTRGVPVRARPIIWATGLGRGRGEQGQAERNEKTSQGTPRCEKAPPASRHRRPISDEITRRGEVIFPGGRAAVKRPVCDFPAYLSTRRGARRPRRGPGRATRTRRRDTGTLPLHLGIFALRLPTCPAAQPARKIAEPAPQVPMGNHRGREGAFAEGGEAGERCANTGARPSHVMGEAD